MSRKRNYRTQNSEESNSNYGMLECFIMHLLFVGKSQKPLIFINMNMKVLTFNYNTNQVHKWVKILLIRGLMKF